MYIYMYVYIYIYITINEICMLITIWISGIPIDKCRPSPH